MIDVLPVVLISADEHLVVELVWRHRERRHVRRKLEKGREAVSAKEAQSGRKRSRRSVPMRGGENEAPLAERRDVDVVWISLQPRLLQSLHDATERIAREHRRGALNDHQALHAEVARDGPVKRRGIEFSERIVRGVGKINHNEIETVSVRIHPGKGVGVDDAHAGGKQGFVIELGQHGMRGEEPGHFGIEIDEGNALDLRVFQNFAESKTVAAAEDEHAAGERNSGEPRMYERFMVAVLVAGAELQVAVEKKTKVVLEAR